MTNYQLFWLRELSGGALGGDYGSRAVSLGDLPINETLAGRIRALSPPDTLLNLHLPYLTFRDRKEWAEKQLTLPVISNGRDRIIVGDEAHHQFAALLPAQRLHGPAAPLAFRDERIWKASDWDTAVRPVLAAHRIQLNPGWCPSGPFRVSWAVELPGEFATAWANVPHRRDRRFLDLFRGVSTSIQRALRIWLPFQYFHQSARFAKTHFAHPYLVYELLPPHPSRRKTQLTFHVLEPQRVVRSMTRLTKLMADQLRRAAVRMGTDEVEAQEEYCPAQGLEIVRAMHGLPRTFAGLLSLEAFVVEEFVRFAGVAHHCGGAALRAKTLVEPGLELLHNLRCRLARSYGGESYENLVNLILLAATAGLVWREEPDFALQARVTVTDLATGAEIRGESRFSYANF